jgi:hypothetical protein
VSDLNDLIATNAVRAYNEGLERGVISERERIIELLHDNIGWCEALEYEAFADQLEELIKGEQK